MSVPGMIGTIDHYHTGKSFSNYVERFEIMCKLNKVKPDEKKQWFISLSGDDVFDEIKLLFPKKDVNDLDYDEMINKLKCRFDKTEPALMHRYKFYNKYQGHAESAENFVLAVKLLAESCNFKEFKDEAVRDRLIIGLRDKKLQRKILMEDEITVDAVEKLIITHEEAGERTKEIVDPNDAGAILSVKNRLGQKHEEYNSRRFGRFRSRSRSRDRSDSRSRSRDRGTGFYRSGREREWNGHSKAVCNHCKRVGHIKKNCWFLNKNSVKFVKQEESVTESVPFDKFNRIRIDDASDNSDIECLKIGAINNVSEPCLVKAVVQGHEIVLEIDTGSAVSVISQMMYKKLFRSFTLDQCNKRLVVVNGSRLIVSGQL